MPYMQVLVFSQKDEPSLLLRSVAMQFSAWFEFALVDAGSTELLHEFQVVAVPAVVVVHLSGQSTQYHGPLQAVPLSNFLRPFAEEEAQNDAQRYALSYDDAVSCLPETASGHALQYRSHS